jgi:hypothetical protein
VYVVAVWAVFFCGLVRADSINERIVQFCRECEGTVVGDGRDRNLLDSALAAAGARPFLQDHPFMQSGWGPLILYKEGTGTESYVMGNMQMIRPGDILQFQQAQTRKDGSRKYSKHLGVIVGVDATGLLTVLAQKCGGKKAVHEVRIDLQDKNEGWLAIYRACPRGIGNMTLEDMNKPPLKLSRKRMKQHWPPIAAPGRADTLNDKILAFCVARQGQQVGNGICNQLVTHALEAAGAQRSRHHPESNYANGRPIFHVEGSWSHLNMVGNPRDIRPGDIYSAARLKKNPDGSPRVARHTAIVAGVDATGTIVTALNQNAGGKKYITINYYNLRAMVPCRIDICRARPKWVDNKVNNANDEEKNGDHSNDVDPDMPPDDPDLPDDDPNPSDDANPP